jgi:hypothetical protein
MGNRSGEAGALIALGFVARRQSSLEQCCAWLLEGLVITQSLGNRQLELSALGNLGSVEHALGQHGNARVHLSRALRLANSSGNKVLTCYLCIPAAAVTAAVGMPAAAEQVLSCALAGLAESGFLLDRDDEAMVEVARAAIATACAAANPKEPATTASVAGATAATLTYGQLVDYTLTALGPG